MQIIYTCPKCGYDLQHIAICTNPPIYQSQCPICGWTHEQKSTIVRIQYPGLKNNENKIS